MSSLQDRVFVITGGNSGIGLATARVAAERGARVVITGRDPEALAVAASEIGGDARAFTADVSDLTQIEDLFRRIGESYDRIDALFVNAGIANMRPLEGVTAEFYDEMMDINLKGAYFTVQKALPLLGEGSSVIFNTSAVNRLGVAGMTVYAASKAALRSLARTMSAELAPRGIRVNAVSPGPVETPLFGKTGLSEEDIRASAEVVRTMVPLGRFARAEEIAKAVAFLASPDSSYVLGTEVVVDGGMSQL